MRRASSLLLVFAGGAVGTLLRVGVLALTLGIPEPVAMLAINVCGALLLGVLTGAVRRHAVRLLLGTGLLGGFTSYSAMILLAQPGEDGAWWGLGLAALTVVAGTVAAGVGFRLGSRWGAS